MKKLPRLEFGFLSSSVSPINMVIPWQPSSKDGLFKMNYNTKDAVYDDLYCWANTNKGERVMDVNFGLDARRYLFNPDIVVKDVLENNAREQISTYFSNLSILKLNVLTYEEDSTLPENSVRLYLEVSPKSDENIVIKLNEIIS